MIADLARWRVEWQACRAMLRQVVNDKRQNGGLGFNWTLLALAALAMLPQFLVAPKLRVALGMFGGMLLFFWVCMWWAFLLGTFRKLDQPVAAALVPNFRARLLMARAAALAVAVALLTAAIGPRSGHTALAALVSALVLSTPVLLYTLLGPWLVLVWAIQKYPEAGLWLGAFILSDSALPLLALALAASWYAQVGALLRPASAAAPAAQGPFRRFLALQLRVLAAPDHRQAFDEFARASAPSASAPPSALAARCAALRLALVRFERRLTGARPAFAEVLDRAPQGDLQLLWIWLLAGGSLVRAGHALFGAGSAQDGLLKLRIGLLFFLLMMQLGALFWHIRLARARPAEQALLRLSALAPAASELNRALARYLLARSYRRWGYLSALALCMLWLLGGAPGELARAAAACLLLLALPGVMLNDYAGAGGDWAGTAPAFWLGTAAMICLAGIVGGWPVPGLSSAALWGRGAPAIGLFGMLMLWRRWHLMVRAAPAFPAGRLRRQPA